jgi:hypothetical protein
VVDVLAPGTVPIGPAVLHGGNYRNTLRLREVAADEVKGDYRNKRPSG